MKNFVAALGFFLIALGTVKASTAEICQKDKETMGEILNPLTTIAPALLQEAIDILSEHFGTKVQIKSVVQLSEPGRRNLVLRISLNPKSKDIPKSLILKQSLVEGSCKDDQKVFARFARDWAGLEFLSKQATATPLTPRFYGGSTTHRFVLLEDLGKKHISLVDSLTIQDIDIAKAALQRFMERLGRLHANSYGKTSHYLDLLQTLNPDEELWQIDAQRRFDNISSQLDSLLSKIGVRNSEEIKFEIHNVITALSEPGPFTTLIHGDICPDNVFDNPEKNKLYFIDFEWAFVKNALLDGTYLRMGMPTCWCAKSIPEDLIESLETIYRQELIKKIPAAQNDERYHKAYVDGCAFWMIKAALLVEDVLEKDDTWPSGPIPDKSLWLPEANQVRPRILSRLQAFIDVSKKHEKRPHLKIMAQQILEYLKIQWPNTQPMDMYPAFIPNQKAHE